MANDASKAFVAGSGRVLHAPAGTTLPDDATTALAVAFKEFGYIGEDGVKESEPVSDNKTKAWGGDVIRTVRSEHAVTYAFTVLEDNDEVILATRGEGTAAAYTINGSLPGPEVFVIEALDGDIIKRTVIPNGQITELGEVQYASGNVSGRQITITGYPDAAKNKAYIYKAEVV